MKHNIISLISVVIISVGLNSCSEDVITLDNENHEGKSAMEFTFSHPSQSRATETSFENGDAVGLFVSAIYLNIYSIFNPILVGDKTLIRQ